MLMKTPPETLLAARLHEALVKKEAPKLPKTETAVIAPVDFNNKYEINVDISSLGGRRARKCRVKLSELHLDESYQYRPETEPGRVRQLEAWLKERNGFDKTEAGAIHVNVRKGGRMFIIDGGGRVWMALRAGEEYIDAYVYEGLDWDEEKAFFLRKNQDRRTIRAPHLFAVEASRGTEPHATIVRHLETAKYGLERVAGDGKRALFAPSSLLHVFYLDGTGDILELTLLDLRATVGDQAGVDGRLLVTVGMLRFCGAGRDNPNHLRSIIQHNPQEKGNPPVSVAETYNAARQMTTGIITSRTVQSRDLNPFLFKLLAARYNYNKQKRIDPTLAMKVLALFETPELVERWGKRGLSKDTWSWKYCQ